MRRAPGSLRSARPCRFEWLPPRWRDPRIGVTSRAESHKPSAEISLAICGLSSDTARAIMVLQARATPAADADAYASNTPASMRRRPSVFGAGRPWFRWRRRFRQRPALERVHERCEQPWARRLAFAVCGAVVQELFDGRHQFGSGAVQAVAGEVFQSRTQIRGESCFAFVAGHSEASDPAGRYSRPRRMMVGTATAKGAGAGNQYHHRYNKAAHGASLVHAILRSGAVTPERFPGRGRG